MKKLTPQDLRVLALMRQTEWFTLGDALKMDPPVYRLSERIRDLQKFGCVIEHDRVEGKTYGKYKLIYEPPTLKPAPTLNEELVAHINAIPPKKEVDKEPQRLL